jgi:ribonuclease HII
MVCGIDEAGRGPLAGPVTAAAVILPADFPFELLNDSKKLSEKKREIAMAVIYDKAIAWSVAWSWPFEIDRINILRASLLAMKRAYESLGVKADEVLVDGLYCPEIDEPCRAIVRGDSLVPEIMAASILAKTARDRWMRRYSWIDDRYGYERHKGYPTKEHKRLLGIYGPSAIQRKTFNY